LICIVIYSLGDTVVLLDNVMICSRPIGYTRQFFSSCKHYALAS